MTSRATPPLSDIPPPALRPRACAGSSNMRPISTRCRPNLIAHHINAIQAIVKRTHQARYRLNGQRTEPAIARRRRRIPRLRQSRPSRAPRSDSRAEHRAGGVMRRDSVQLSNPSLRGAQRRSNPSRGVKKEWIASSRSLSSGAHSRDPLAPRNDVDIVARTTSPSRSAPVVVLSSARRGRGERALLF